VADLELLTLKLQQMNIESTNECHAQVLINRIWEMPNSRTFKIKAIRDLIIKYSKNKKIINISLMI